MFQSLRSALNSKREKFHVSIRRQKTEALFRRNRQLMKEQNDQQEKVQSIFCYFKENEQWSNYFISQIKINQELYKQQQWSSLHASLADLLSNLTTLLQTHNAQFKFTLLNILKFSPFELFISIINHAPSQFQDDVFFLVMRLIALIIDIAQLISEPLALINILNIKMFQISSHTQQLQSVLCLFHIVQTFIESENNVLQLINEFSLLEWLEQLYEFSAHRNNEQFIKKWLDLLQSILELEILTISPNSFDRLIGMAFFFLEDNSLEGQVLLILKLYSNINCDPILANENLFCIEGLVEKIFDKVLQGNIDGLYLLANLSQVRQENQIILLEKYDILSLMSSLYEEVSKQSIFKGKQEFVIKVITFVLLNLICIEHPQYIDRILFSEIYLCITQCDLILNDLQSIRNLAELYKIQIDGALMKTLIYIIEKTAMINSLKQILRVQNQPEILKMGLDAILILITKFNSISLTQVDNILKKVQIFLNIDIQQLENFGVVQILDQIALEVEDPESLFIVQQILNELQKQ